MVRCKHCKNHRYILMAKVIQKANMLFVVGTVTKPQAAQSE